MIQINSLKNTFLNTVGNLIAWCHFLMILLLIFSLCWYAERVLYYDSAYQFFKLVNFESYNIEANRWSTILVQTLPLLAIKLGLSLKSVLIIFSFSYVLIGYLVFLINVYVLKNTPAGIAVLFLYTLCVRDSYFYCVTELPIGMLFTTTFYAWLFYPKNTVRSIHSIVFALIGFVILLICFFFHPMTFFSIIFITGFYLIQTKDYQNTGIISLVLLTILLYTSKMFFTDSDSYEGDLFGQLKETPNLILNVFHLNSTHFYFGHTLKIYWLVNSLALLISAFYLINKNWVSLTWFVLNFGGFLLVCFITFNKGNSNIAMEKYFIPLALLIAIPLLHDIISIKKFQFIGVLVCLFILSRGIYQIYSAKSFYSQHLEYIDTLIHFANSTHTTSKLVLSDKHVNQNYTTWACATETLLRTATNGVHQTTIYLAEEEEIDQIDTHESDLFLCVPFYRDWNAKTLNQNYFSLPDKPYILDNKSTH